MSKLDGKRTKTHEDKPETIVVTRKGIEAISFFSRQLGGLPRFGSDPILGFKLIWEDEEVHRPMANLFLGPKTEFAYLEAMHSDEFFALIGWCLINGFAYRFVADRGACDESVSDSGTMGLRRLSVAAAKLKIVGETVHALGGACIEPAQAEGPCLYDALAAHSGLFVAYKAEDEAPDRLMCGLISLDAGWLSTAAAAIASAVGETGGEPD